MPLVHSSSNKALAQNMRTLHTDVGKSPHVQSQKQAVAIALSTQREARKKKNSVRREARREHESVRTEAAERRIFRSGQVSDRARGRMRRGGDEDADHIDAASR